MRRVGSDFKKSHWPRHLSADQHVPRGADIGMPRLLQHHCQSADIGTIFEAFFTSADIGMPVPISALRLLKQPLRVCLKNISRQLRQLRQLGNCGNRGNRGNRGKMGAFETRLRPCGLDILQQIFCKS
jgi:hypothetical protein